MSEWAYTGLAISLPQALAYASTAACSFNGDIFVAVNALNASNFGVSGIGSLYRSVGGIGPFTQVAPILNFTYEISDLFVFNGKLYGWGSYNTTLLEWNGTDAWVQVGIGDGVGAGFYGGMASRLGLLYTCVHGRLYIWNGSNALATIADFGSDFVQGNQMILNPSNNDLWMGTTSGRLYRFNGVASEIIPTPLNSMGYACPFVLNNNVYAIMQNGRLFQWNGGSAWSQVIGDTVSSSTGAYHSIVINGIVYMGVGASSSGVGGQLYTWDGSSSGWSIVADRYSDYDNIGQVFVHNSRLLAVAFKYNSANPIVLLEIFPPPPAPTTASSPWVNRNSTPPKVKDAKGLVPSTIDSEVTPETKQAQAVSDAKGHNPRIQYSESSPDNQRSTTSKDASGYGLEGKKGQRTGFISLMPELSGYGAANPGLGTGYMIPFFSESLALAKEFRELDVVSASRANDRRRVVYQSPEGKVEFPIRSNDIIPVLQTHFQKRIGTTPNSGTTFYEFVPNKGRVDLIGSAFGTGSYVDPSRANAFSVSLFKDIGGNGFLFKTGVVDKLTFKFHAMIEPSIEASFKFREGSTAGTSTSHPYGTYSSKPCFSPSSCSVDFLGMSVIDLEFTSDNQIETKNVMGDSRPIHKFGQHTIKGNAVVDFGKNVMLGYGSVLSGSSFSVSATMYNADHDKIVFQMPDCRLSEFPTGFAGIYNVPFQAHASDDGSTAPIKVQVWTQNYDAYSFQPN